MTKRHLFFSYHHQSDYRHLVALRELLQKNYSADYGFKDENLGEEAKYFIAKKIQYRIWSSSVVVVLVGEHTASSSWIDWEIWYALQRFTSKTVTRRAFKPKGLLALYLPVINHAVPRRLQDNIDSGYALKINWNEISGLFYDKIEAAYNNRNKLEMIVNDRKLSINPHRFKLLQQLSTHLKKQTKKKQ